MSTLHLTSCVSRKRERASPAKDLYVSDWFRKARAYVEAQGSPWFVLSAEHGLVDPDTRIAPYERTLNAMPVAERRAWASKVLTQLRERLQGVERVVVLAGERYREFLIPDLESLCPVVEVPLAGLRIGEQLRWLKQRLQP